MPDRTCSVDGCPARAKARGLCSTHHERERKARLALLRTDPDYTYIACAIDDCNEPKYCQGYCSSHYHRLRKAGALTLRTELNADKVCTVDGCAQTVSSLGFCRAHYRRFTRHGDPTAGKQPMPPYRGTLRDVFEFFQPGDPPPEGVIWPWRGRLNRAGYGEFCYRGRRWLAHRVSYELFIGPIPPGHVIRHINDTPIDCNPHNLLTGTQAQNLQDMRDRNRDPRGVEHGRHILTEEEVLEIRFLRNECGWVARRIAERFCISETTVYRVAKKIHWTHLP